MSIVQPIEYGGVESAVFIHIVSNHCITLYQVKVFIDDIFGAVDSSHIVIPKYIWWVITIKI